MEINLQSASFLHLKPNRKCPYLGTLKCLILFFFFDIKTEVLYIKHENYGELS
jgi:hypothetical protein